MSLTCSCLISYLWSMQRTFRGELPLRLRPRTCSFCSKRHLPSHILSEDLAWDVGYYTMGKSTLFICSFLHVQTINQPLSFWVWSQTYLTVVGNTFRSPPKKSVLIPWKCHWIKRYHIYCCYQARTKCKAVVLNQTDCVVTTEFLCVVFLSGPSTHSHVVTASAGWLGQSMIAACQELSTIT